MKFRTEGSGLDETSLFGTYTHIQGSAKVLGHLYTFKKALSLGIQYY